MSQPRQVSIDEATNLLSLSRSTIQRRFKDGSLTERKLRGKMSSQRALPAHGQAPVVAVLGAGGGTEREIILRLTHSVQHSSTY